MNKLSFFLSFSFIILYSQVWSQLSMASVNGNIVYVGAENKLEFNTSDSLTFKTSNGKVIKVRNNQYFYVPEKIGRGQIEIKNEMDGTTQSLSFKVIDIPIPNAMLEVDNILPRKDNKYIDRNSYSKDRIKSFNNIILLLNNFNIPVRLSVIEYELWYKGKQGKIKKIRVDGLLFYKNEEIKKLIDNCKSGDIFMINHILSENNVNENEQWIPSIYFVVE